MCMSCAWHGKRVFKHWYDADVILEGRIAWWKKWGKYFALIFLICTALLLRSKATADKELEIVRSVQVTDQVIEDVVRR